MPYKKYVKNVTTPVATAKPVYAYAVYSDKGGLLAIFKTKTEAVQMYYPNEVKKVELNIVQK